MIRDQSNNDTETCSNRFRGVDAPTARVSPVAARCGEREAERDKERERERDRERQRDREREISRDRRDRECASVKEQTRESSTARASPAVARCGPPHSVLLPDNDSLPPDDDSILPHDESLLPGRKESSSGSKGSSSGSDKKHLTLFQNRSAIQSVADEIKDHPPHATPQTPRRISFVPQTLWSIRLTVFRAGAAQEGRSAPESLPHPMWEESPAPHMGVSYLSRHTQVGDTERGRRNQGEQTAESIRMTVGAIGE